MGAISQRVPKLLFCIMPLKCILKLLPQPLGVNISTVDRLYLDGNPCNSTAQIDIFKYHY